VRVETVQRARQLPGPLLLDPGPPRVIAAYHDADGQLVYARATGDGGVDPVELGLDAEEYARVVYGDGNETLLLRLLRVAAARVRRWVRVRARRMLVCGHLWMARVPPVNAVEFCDVSDVLPHRPHAAGVVRLGAWETFFHKPDEDGRRWPPVRVGELEPLGN